jgi:phage FluMu gp28-like protein
MSSAAVPLHRYQRQWMLDESRFKIGMFARQTGKTFTTALEVVDDCFAAIAEGRRARWVILSRGERQAKEAMDEGVKRHAKAYEIGVDEQEVEWKGGSGASYKALEVTLPGGSRITALPANPDTARGFSANVFLDEFAFHANSKAIWGALFPVISAGHKLRVTSTPNGKNNKFYELMTAKDSTWSRHHVDIYRAVADGLPRDIEELKAGLNDEDLWSQEYELDWLDDASAWLPYELISTCEDETAGFPEAYGGGTIFIGNDIARRRHLWVVWVLELVGDVFVTREIVERRNITFREQDDTLDEIVARYGLANIGRIAMDQTGMGEKPVEDAKTRYGDLRVEGVLLNGARPFNLATIVKDKFEDRTVRIPMGNQVLRADLHKIKKITGATGAPRMVTPEDEKDHADRFWALALALGGADMAVTPAAGVTVPPPPAPAGMERHGQIHPRMFSRTALKSLFATKRSR